MMISRERLRASKFTEPVSSAVRAAPLHGNTAVEDLMLNLNLSLGETSPRTASNLLIESRYAAPAERGAGLISEIPVARAWDPAACTEGML